MLTSSALRKQNEAKLLEAELIGENTQEKLRRLQIRNKDEKRKIKARLKISFNDTIFVTKISYLPLLFSGTHMLKTNDVYLLAH